MLLKMYTKFNMKYLFKIINTILFLIILCLTAFSCTKKENEKAVEKKTIKPRRIIKDKILIILGKDYYDHPGILKYLNDEYGVGEIDSPVQILKYDEMLGNSKYPRLKLINEKLEEYKSSILISVGLPENGGRYLIKCAATNPKPAIITLLPMEELLPLEAGSDIVVDFKIPTALVEDNTALNDDEIMLLITASVFAGENINAKIKAQKSSPIEDFRDALFTAQKVVSKVLFEGNYFIKPYLDPESGLPSHKYLIIHTGSSEDIPLNNKNNSDEEVENNEITNPDDLEGGV